MNSIEPGLAIGNLEDAMAHVALREQGIRSVLTVSGFPRYPRPGLDWRFAPLYDGGGNSPEQFAEAIDLVADLRTEQPGLLVHCAEGKSRSVVIVSLYLARVRGWKPERALAHVSSRRSVALPDDVLWGQARAFFESRTAGASVPPLLS